MIKSALLVEWLRNKLIWKRHGRRIGIAENLPVLT